MDMWDRQFETGNKGELNQLSADQCKLATEVWGIDGLEGHVAAACRHIRLSTKDGMVETGKKIKDAVMKNPDIVALFAQIEETLATMGEDIMRLDEQMAAAESREIEEEVERKAFTSRQTKMLFEPDDDDWASRLHTIGQKKKQDVQEQWTDRLGKVGSKPRYSAAARKSQHWSNFAAPGRYLKTGNDE